MFQHLHVSIQSYQDGLQVYYVKVCCPVGQPFDALNYVIIITTHFGNISRSLTDTTDVFRECTSTASLTFSVAAPKLLN